MNYKIKLERKSFFERFEEVRNGLCLSYNEIARKIGIDRESFHQRIRAWRSGKNIYFTSVKNIADVLDRIPLAFRTPNGKIENLGNQEFLYGENIENYIGKVIKKHREAKGYKKRKLEEICGLSKYILGGYENGSYIPSTKTIEIITQELDLTPLYLLPKLRTIKGMNL